MGVSCLVSRRMGRPVCAIPSFVLHEAKTQILGLRKAFAHLSPCWHALMSQMNVILQADAKAGWSLWWCTLIGCNASRRCKRRNACQPTTTSGCSRGSVWQKARSTKRWVVAHGWAAIASLLFLSGCRGPANLLSAAAVVARRCLPSVEGSSGACAGVDLRRCAVLMAACVCAMQAVPGGAGRRRHARDASGRLARLADW